MDPLSALPSSHLIEMAIDDVLASNGRPLTITCLSGAVWLTDGIGGECVMHSGQRRTVLSRGKVCIQALVPSRIEIEMRQPAMRALPLSVPAPAG